MDQDDGHQLLNLDDNMTSFPTLCKVSTYRLERQGQVPRLGDIWISKGYIKMARVLRTPKIPKL
jgi:hypothetical protein